jgi:hypothetical protein
MNFKLLLKEIELNESFIPVSDTLYDVYFQEPNIFYCDFCIRNVLKLTQEGIENTPLIVKYQLLKPLSDFTIEEKIKILDYRGLTLSDGFELKDVFMEQSFIKLIK